MNNRLKTLALTSCAVIALATAAHAQDTAKFDIAGGDLKTALQTFATQTSQEVLFSTDIVAGRRTKGVTAETDPQSALVALLEGTGLTYQRTPTGTLLVVRASDPQSGSAAGDGADGTVQALIVTAQKREEDIQDVPIAISAFTQEDLTRSQVAGGPDLMTQVPNFTFTKTNFSGYSIQIRGIGTQAISATTDAAVAVAFNNTPFIRNRFFEQEFYDLQRVEVLRGPQGTLYGRNATAGVVNIISAKPTFHYEAKLSADVGNYNSQRFEGMINLPLVEDKVAVRLAGAWTKRNGYDTNQITGNQIDGRDLWSTRLSLRFEPTDNIHANLIWEHFNEDDDRLRSGKQLCHEDEVTSITAPDSTGQMITFPTTHYQWLPEAGLPKVLSGVQAMFSQGCKPASLYSPDSFQTPNGLSLPYTLPLSEIGLPLNPEFTDAYVNATQSRDLRVIESTVDPQYRANTDLAELQFSIDLSNHLTLTSETGYLSDVLFSTQDFNRFNTRPGIFNPNTVVTDANGVFCDPQVGCADRLVVTDLSTAKSRHFSEEIRVASNYEGPFNFSLGANFLRYDTEDKYYVFINSLTATAAERGAFNTGQYIPGVSDNSECLVHGFELPDPGRAYSVTGCVYIDPNPIGSLNDMGHNYFLSKNPYKLISYAVFGEAYYSISDSLKLTGGLRWTVDKKEAPRIPTWVLAGGNTVVPSGAGYSVAEVIEQEWREPTGRLTLDWKPRLSFTDETLVYASAAHGYKAGGANPPTYGVALYAGVAGGGSSAGSVGSDLIAENSTHPKTFEPEFVNAFELGSKNTLDDGKLTLNGDAFYYDYTGYQISQIVDRAAVNLNFDAKVWGLEVEGDWRPLENLRLGLKLGYEKTRVADGEKAIDLMDRTAGDPNWIVVSPFPTFPSNCILPRYIFVGQNVGNGAINGMSGTDPQLVDVGGLGGGNPSGCELAYVLGLDPVTAAPYVPNPTVGGPSLNTLFVHPNYPGFNPATAPNHGAGIDKDLSGNELPNAPHFTATIAADYTLPLPSDWLMTLHTDLYYQSEAWTRIFNTEGYDKLKAYTNVNLAAIFSNEDAGWKVMAYVKNVFDRASITGAFLNSDDTGLTTNVFLTEPRLYGIRVTKEWSGGPWWTGANANHTGPYPLTVEIGGQVQRQDAPYQTMVPDFASTFSEALNPTASQNRDLDWGDGREIKLIYRPAGSSWNVSLGARYGETNASTRLHKSETVEEAQCGFPRDSFFGKARCDPTYSAFGQPPGYFYNAYFVARATDWSDQTAREREDHTIVDFVVGKEVGLGAIPDHDSMIGVGLRFANLTSKSAVWMDGVPDLYIPDAWRFKYSSRHRDTATLNATREFKGAGPTLSWNAAKSLLGNNQTGRMDIDWSVNGGVLFGKQRAMVNGQLDEAYFHTKYGYVRPPTTEQITPVAINRDKSTTVPVLDFSLGLSYEIQRIKVSSGYRWERYFNAIDAGYTQHKSYDRTFDGPYFKIAIGFGG